MIATYLYAGLLTDTQKFSISSVTSETLELAAYQLSFKLIFLQLIKICLTEIINPFSMKPIYAARLFMRRG